MEENLDNPPTRRAAERRTRSNRAKVPRGSPASREQQQSIRLVTNAWTRVSLDWCVRDREKMSIVSVGSTYKSPEVMYPKKFQCCKTLSNPRLGCSPLLVFSQE